MIIDSFSVERVNERFMYLSVAVVWVTGIKYDEKALQARLDTIYILENFVIKTSFHGRTYIPCMSNSVNKIT